MVKNRRKKDRSVKERTGKKSIRLKPVVPKTPSISACMIVKNEEELLPQCLESIKDFVDEIIIVDTGSTDNTVEIAKSYGAKVYHHPWENDFSKHRNQSISYASGEWIFIIDADEELMRGDGTKLRQAITDTSFDSVFITVISVYNKRTSQTHHNSIRIFKNNGSIRYTGIVHNLLKGYTQSKIFPIRLMHYGYDLDEKKKTQKFERTSGLLKAQISDDPSNPMPHHYLGSCYLTHGMFELAAEESRKAIELAEKMNEKSSLYLWSHFIASSAYYNLQQFDIAEQFALGAIEKYEKHLDSWFMLSLIYFARKRWAEFFKTAKRYFEILEEVKTEPGKFGSLAHHSAADDWKVRLYLGFAFSELGESEKAKEVYGRLLNDENTRWNSCCAIGMFYLDKEDYDSAEDYLNQALSETPENMSLLKAKAKIYASKKNWAEWQKLIEKMPNNEVNGDILFNSALYEMKNQNYNKAIGYLTKFINDNPLDDGAYVNLGLAYKKLGDLKTAQEVYEKALTINSHSFEALTNLGYLHLEKENGTIAKRYFFQAMEEGKPQVDIYLALSKINVDENDIETCVKNCESLLELLGIPTNRVLYKVEDLADLYREIGETLLLQNQIKMAGLAIQIALRLSCRPSNGYQAGIG